MKRIIIFIKVIFVNSSQFLPNYMIFFKIFVILLYGIRNILHPVTLQKKSVIINNKIYNSYMKKIILSSFLFLSLSICAAFSQVNVNINDSLVFSDSNANIAFREILFSTSPIQPNSATNGTVGYFLISNPNVFTNSFNTFVPAGTANGSYFIAVRNDDVSGLTSDWSTNLNVNFFNKPSPPNGLKVIALP